MRASLLVRDHVTIPQELPPALDLHRHALFLDLDGTLVDIEERPHAVTASDTLRNLLRTLSAAMDGAVALITGRTLGEADRILGGALGYVAGVHGYEMQRGAQIMRDTASLTPIAEAAADIRALLQQHALPALVEDKRASLALHYRHAPEAGAQLLQLANEIAAKRGLRVMQGKMVVELVAGARTKGDALKLFMSEAPFRGRIPVKLGDDRTDEDAFAAANALGGFGVLIGMPRESLASYNLAGPSAVFDWLSAPLQERAP
jgi:trehalose 6-phosphate phosphatase